MDVKLVVTSGKHQGQVVPVARPKFLIGRADDCHLRPHSDVVSRYHCVVLVEPGFVVVRDFGSKNGTFVNDEQIMGEQELKNGDLLRVGQIEFRVELSVDVGGQAKPQVADLREAASRTVATESDPHWDISDWLMQDDASGTVLGMSPKRGTTSTEPPLTPKSDEDTKGEESETQRPKK